MNLEPRQEYGLGSIVKSVKKAVSGAAKGIKSLAKSDLGKAALLYAGTAGLGYLGCRRWTLDQVVFKFGNLCTW